jgi:hypothetical protein
MGAHAMGAAADGAEQGHEKQHDSSPHGMKKGQLLEQPPRDRRKLTPSLYHEQNEKSNGGQKNEH